MRVRREVKLDHDDIEWFISVYPTHSLSWALGVMLREFRALHNQTPADYAKIGAAELKRALQEDK